MMDRRKIVISALIAGALVLVSALALGGFYFGQRMAERPAPEPAEVREGTPAPAAALPADIEVVRTDAEREKGLAGRLLIPDDYAMLFVFDEEGRHGFWMKGMLASIDIIWVTEDGVIAGIEAGVSPDTYPNIYAPDVPVRYVLETRAGYAREHGWKEGKRFDLSAYAEE